MSNKYIIAQLIKSNAISKNTASNDELIEKIRKSCFPEQLKFIDDQSDKVAHCSRRAAKTYSAVIDLFISALKYPKSQYLVCGLTFDSTFEIFVDNIFRELQDTFNIDLKIHAKGYVKFSNGSVIKFYGIAKDKNQAGKMKGKKYKIILIDEAQDMDNIDLEKVIKNSLRPTLLDGRGRIIITGTSCDNQTTYFYHLTVNKQESADRYGFKYHYWNVISNPHNKQQFLEEKKRQLKINPNWEETKEYRQEWLAEWVTEINKLVYKYHQHNFINPSTSLPWDLPINSDLIWVLGVDVGFKDFDAYVELAYSNKDNKLYIASVYSENGKSTEHTANMLFSMSKRRDYSYIVVDGADAKGLEMYKERIGERIIRAEKTAKLEYQSQFNADAAAGIIRVLPQAGEQILKEASKLIKDPNNPREDHPSMPNHVCFVKGTKILTNYGLINIEDLNNNYLILTRQGFKPIERIIVHQSNNVINNIGLTGTKDHPIFTTKGKKDLQSITNNDIYYNIEEYQCQKLINMVNQNRLFTMERFSEGIQNQITKIIECITELKKVNFYIEQFMKMKWIQFLMVIVYTILMKIHLTIIYQTFNYYLKKNIIHSTLKNTLKEIKKRFLTIWIKQELKQVNGIVQNKQKNFIKNWENHLGIMQSIKNIFAKFVIKNIEKQTKL